MQEQNGALERSEKLGEEIVNFAMNGIFLTLDIIKDISVAQVAK